MKKLYTSFKQTLNSACNQRGAMFGMDARVALLIASVLAAAGGVTLMSKLERSRVEGTELALELIKNSVETHYQMEGITALAQNIQELLDKGFLKDPSFITDPWQNNWKYQVVQRSISIEDFDVTEQLLTIHSTGKDGVNDTPVPTSAAEWALWQPQNDDIGTKYSTIEIEKARVSEYRGRAKLIIDKLESYASANYLEAQRQCDTGDEGTEWCVDKPEVGDSYTDLNFYPQSSTDGTGALYFDNTVSGGSAEIYVSGDEFSMQKLMENLGLPAAFATDPWKRVLVYDSNYIQDRSNAHKPPFTASIAYE